MSRTYRYRHGFRTPKGVKYTQARMSDYEDRFEEDLWARLAHEVYDYPCIVGTRKWMQWYDRYRTIGSHQECISMFRYSAGNWETIRRFIRQNMQIQNVWMNPHMGYGAQFCAHKKYSRTEGNRRGRHADRQKLNGLLRVGALAEAYETRWVPSGFCPPGCDECEHPHLYFVYDENAAYALEQELSRKHTNWDNWDLT